jgi:hypothetical protein
MQWWRQNISVRLRRIAMAVPEAATAQPACIRIYMYSTYFTEG